MIESLLAAILILGLHALEVSPDPLDFGEVIAGDEPMASLAVANTGNNDLRLLGITFNRSFRDSAPKIA